MFDSRNRRQSLAWLAAISVLASACAAAPGGRPPEHDRIIVSSDPAGTVADINIVREDRVGSHLVPLTSARLWPVMPAAYEQLGLPAPAADAARMAVIVQNHSLNRRLGEARLSELFDCGSDMAGRVADTHRLRLSVESWLEASGASTTVHTRAEAVALSPERSGAISCASTGQLERRIADNLARIAGR